MSEVPEKQAGAVPQNNTDETVRIDMDHVSSVTRTAVMGQQSAPEFTVSKDGDSDIPKLTPKPREKYIFSKSIGRGGMKMVIQVKDRDTMRDIAMAVFPDAAHRPAADSRRFIDEARITARLEHPNIVPVHDIGIDASGAPYFTMKLLRGETLASVLKKLGAGDPEYRELYPLRALLRIFNKVCDAVAFAHSKGVIHLDLKPENIQIGDFGEVLLMDFGLAKVISKADEDVMNEAPGMKTQNYIPGVTMDGVTKGTPGYMAPEQAAGKNSLKDFRTDVYSLGAILYSIATCENPLSDRSDMKQMMIDTVKGRIIPPRERTPERLIPGALEAVILKAMSVHPQSRYQSVKELRDEIRAFLNGFATQAEKAGVAKQLLLFIRRNKITFPAIAVSIFLLLGISFYGIQESARRKAGWVELCSDQFTDGQVNIENSACYDPTLYYRVPNWNFSEQGMVMRSGEWFFIDKLNMGAGERVVLKFIPQEGASVKVALHTKIDPLNYGWENPSGYTVLLSGLGGSLDMIYKNRKKGFGTVLASGNTGIVPGKLNTVVIERDNERFLIQVNDEKPLETTDLFPLATDRIGAFGLRAEGEVVLQSLELSRLVLPEKASPLIAGDALLQRNHYEDAVEQYMLIAENYDSGPITDAALAKAYVTAATYLENIEKRELVRKAVKAKLSARMHKYVYRQQILETDALISWKNGDYASSFRTIDQLFELNPRTEIMIRILQLPHKKLSPEVAEKMLEFIAKNNTLAQLDLSGFGLTSLKTLRTMGLRYLDCSGNKLTSLEGLERMPLEVLNCSDNQISSLEPIRFIVIRTLICRNNRITSLEPVNMSRMNSLDVSFNELNSLDSLTGKELQTLAIRKNKISSLVPLYGLRLRLLDAGENLISNLEALKDMPLETLFIDHSLVTDLSPLKGMNLRSLGLYQCTQLKDISPILTMESLQSLSLPPEPGNILPLHELPGLRFLTDQKIIPKSDETGTADAFWKAYYQKNKSVPRK